ncbi:MAG: nitrate reductase associated protein, partial [Oscillatoriales cyanobacterium]
DAATIPESVTAKAQELGLTVTDAQWSGLQPLQRFALIKLSRSSHENKNFLPAVREFHLVA